MKTTLANHFLMSAEETKSADVWAVEHGMSLLDLMEQAGRSVAEAVVDYAEKPESFPGEIVMLCGPGNNGGDGYVAARYLSEWGYHVHVMRAVEDISPQSPEASAMALRWTGSVGEFDHERASSASIIVDALFGVGLSRALEGQYADIIEVSNQCDVFRIAIDVPSGLNADTGNQLGEICFVADATITFSRRKPGHLIAPGRFLSGGLGHIRLADIGIPQGFFDANPAILFENDPAIWSSVYPHAGPYSHKYDRGHMLVLGGREPALGASRLASIAGLRIGAGLVTLAAPSETYNVQASTLTDIMVRRMDSNFGFIGMLADQRINTVLLGPGAGVGEKTAELIFETLNKNKKLVLDADALTSLAGRLPQLQSVGMKELVLTPHEGEFARLFPELPFSADRLKAVQMAAKQTGAVVALKGVSTIVAAPDGRSVINACAPAWLSVGGTGDVLAGITAGLIAQDMPVFEATCAAVWLHSQAAMKAGKGMIASDLLNTLVAVLP
ncbi:NAD(P)H-hydrate dehydratase [Kordiimonas sp. SCSIO 12610]|uniref:NAD(P)H-hydrate dehydratase n=1 Tax=Kordiimonas sp. SCSIO 12610 TaxID=2829597 RepID=UPI00210ED3C0|nr:NAD(P)H-hydrate dehydratase [Kordiimonas sp. SCSIO 12610]UTW54087.1 NAD(P)H-hydrate dehydratase [Kordiimonas sp. SCSIO 12610]